MALVTASLTAVLISDSSASVGFNVKANAATVLRGLGNISHYGKYDRVIMLAQIKDHAKLLLIQLFVG